MLRAPGNRFPATPLPGSQHPSALPAPPPPQSLLLLNWGNRVCLVCFFISSHGNCGIFCPQGNWIGSPFKVPTYLLRFLCRSSRGGSCDLWWHWSLRKLISQLQLLGRHCQALSRHLSVCGPLTYFKPLHEFHHVRKQGHLSKQGQWHRLVLSWLMSAWH